MEDLHELQAAQNTEPIAQQETTEIEPMTSQEADAQPTEAILVVNEDVQAEAPKVRKPRTPRKKVSTEEPENVQPTEAIVVVNEDVQAEVPKVRKPRTPRVKVSTEEPVSEAILPAEELQPEEAAVELPTEEVAVEAEKIEEIAVETEKTEEVGEIEKTEEIGEIKETEKVEERAAVNEEPQEPKLADDFYDHLNKQEVVETMEEVVANSDVVKIKMQVSLLKIRFLQLNKEDKEQHFQAFLAEGGNKEDYAYVPDNLEVRFNKAFEQYKINKTRYAEELEQSKLANLEKKTALLEELKVLVESTESLKQIYDRFKEIQTTWKEIGAVPQANVGELWQNYHFYVEKFFDKIRINRELRFLDFKKNLEIKLDICEKTEALLLEPSPTKAFSLLQQYHQEWKESGQVEEDKKEELWNRFKTASDQINQNSRDYYEQLFKQQEENYKAKLAVCEKLEEITSIGFESVKQVTEISNIVNELFKTWKTLGPAPKEVHNEIWERFRKNLNDFFTAKKQYFTQLNEEQVNNYNLKLNLCIQAEAIALRQDWKKAMAELLDLQKEWRNIGHVSQKQAEVLWKRFRKACDDFFTAKADYFANIDKHEASNLEKKEALIKEVADFQFGESKDANFAALKDFQRRWMEIGYIASSEKDRLWEAFRSAVSKKFDELKNWVNTEDKQKYAKRISDIVEKESSNAGRFLAKEAGILQDKIRQLTDEVNLWENNLGFFANSKNSDALREQFGKKIEKAKQEIAALKEKLTLVRDKK